MSVFIRRALTRRNAKGELKQECKVSRWYGSERIVLSIQLFHSSLFLLHLSAMLRKTYFHSEEMAERRALHIKIIRIWSQTSFKASLRKSGDLLRKSIAMFVHRSPFIKQWSASKRQKRTRLNSSETKSCKMKIGSSVKDQVRSQSTKGAPRRANHWGVSAQLLISTHSSQSCHMRTWKRRRISRLRWSIRSSS